jgi:peptidoglycan hydrolase-like amidase
MAAERNYGIDHRLGQAIFVLVGILLILSTILNNHTLAGDPCEEKPEEKQEECYEEEIREEQEKYESTSKKLSDVRDLMDLVSAKITDLLSQLSITQAEINTLQAEIDDMQVKLNEINTNLTNRKVALDKKLQLRNRVLRAHYQSGSLSTLELLMTTLPSSSVGYLTGFQFINLSYMFDTALTHEALKIIALLSAEIESFEKDKAEAEDLKEELESAQASVFSAKAALGSQKASAQTDYDELAEREGDVAGELASIQEKLDSLTAKQQEILGAKSGMGLISGYIAPEYKLPDPPFEPAYAVMSYGAYTHRRGMSQYGAKGRAEYGKDYKEIIKFYYKEDVKKKDDFPNKLCVQGYGDLDFQYYLNGIAEMPSDWDMDALKAQAIAARSYAYRQQKAGACICTSINCQVFLKSKADDPPDRWEKAVDETEDKIIGGDTGAPGYGWYSSTTGGYISNVGWDKSGSWPGGAYEKRAKSPWFYKAWHTENYRSNSSTCGRDTPWLKEDEMVDILNAWVVWDKGSSSERDHITPVTTNCWSGDPYSHDKMADKADNYGKKFTSVGRITDRTIDSGRTTEICFDTNRGETCIDGQEFAIVFNVRAPHYVAIRRDVYLNALFDIEYED